MSSTRTIIEVQLTSNTISPNPAALRLPLFDTARSAAAWLALGPRLSDEPYAPADRELIDALVYLLKDFDDHDLVPAIRATQAASAPSLRN
jgi:hypothetical protein